MAELAQREEALTTAAVEAASSREQVAQLQAELAEAGALRSAQNRAEVPRLMAELAQREEALNSAAAEAASSREQVAQLASRARGAEDCARRDQSRSRGHCSRVGAARRRHYQCRCRSCELTRAGRATPSRSSQEQRTALSDTRAEAAGIAVGVGAARGGARSVPLPKLRAHASRSSNSIPSSRSWGMHSERRKPKSSA